MAAQSRPRGLLDLPDELLLEIISNFTAIRLDQPHLVAWKIKGKERYRQRENLHSKSALYSLCLASKKLNRVATPALYDAVIASTTEYGLGPLRLLWSTLLERRDLRTHVHYVENLLEDAFGHRPYDDFSNWNEPLGELVKMQMGSSCTTDPNLQTKYSIKLACC